MSWPVYLILLPVVVVLYLYQNKRIHRNLPDGPPGLPFIGNLLNLRGVQLHEKLLEWSRQYGDIYSYRVGETSVVVLGSPETLEDLCVKKGHIYSSRPRLSNQADLCTNDERIINMPYGDDWRKHRKTVHHLLGMQNSKMFKPYQEFETRTMLANLLDNPQTFYDEMVRYSGSVTFSLLLGARFSRADHPIVQRIGKQMEEFFNNVSSGVWLVDWIPILDYLPEALAPWRAKAREFHRHHMSFWLVFYNRIKERTAEGTAPDCFTAKIVERAASGEFTDGEAASLMADLLTAGSETTATSLQWFFKAATRYPEFVREAHEELDQVVGRNRLPGWDDQAKLPYIEAIVKELHRWASAAPLAFQHSTTAEDSYRGKIIPKGTVILPNTNAVHHNEEYFPDHEAFHPGRFLPPDHPKHIPNGATIDKHYAFGIGRRECPGQHVANASLYIAISRLLWAFDIGPKPGCKVGDKLVGSLPVFGPARFECSMSPRNREIIDAVTTAVDSMMSSSMEDAAQYENFLNGIL